MKLIMPNDPLLPVAESEVMIVEPAVIVAQPEKIKKLTHNPKVAIEQLQVILSNPSKKIGFLFGAGISMQDKDSQDLIPGIKDELLDVKTNTFKKGLTSLVVEGITNDSQKECIRQIKIEIGDDRFNVESLLSKISEKERAAGAEKLCGLTKEELVKLRKDIELKIIEKISVHNDPNFVSRQLSHYDFAQWIKNAERNSSVEIFTTNYDYLFEIALEKYQVPYFDGFVGGFKAFFCPEWIESDFAVRNWTKLWKLHGSLGWKIDEDKNVIRMSSDKQDGSGMIYPSFLKYDHSRKQPYLSYMDRLCTFLRQEDSVLFICGYSFGDHHINDAILSSLSRSRSSHVFILKSGELKEEDFLYKDIAKRNSKISIYAKRTAVMGCELGEWKLDREPNKNESYNIIDYGFDEDAIPQDEGWTGKGSFVLGNFTKFTKFLSLFQLNSKFIKKENEK